MSIDDQTLWTEKTTNSNETLAEITKLENNGGLNKIVIPVEKERKGKHFIHLKCTIYSYCGFVINLYVL